MPAHDDDVRARQAVVQLLECATRYLALAEAIVAVHSARNRAECETDDTPKLRER